MNCNPTMMTNKCVQLKNKEILTKPRPYWVLQIKPLVSLVEHDRALPYHWVVNGRGCRRQFLP